MEWWQLLGWGGKCRQGTCRLPAQMGALEAIVDLNRVVTKEEDAMAAEEQAVETGQFTFSGQKQQPVEGLVDFYEPGLLNQLDKNGLLYIVADGAGGTASGVIASQYAVRKILHDFYRSSEPDLEARLLTVIKQTNADILAYNRSMPDRRPVATNVLAALVHHNKLWVASVGDGRVYVVWAQDIERLTSKNGNGAAGPAKEEAKPADLPLVQGLGLSEQVKIDVFSRRLFAGDTVVLCSGGLNGFITEAEIAKTMTRHPPGQASQQLAEQACRRGSRDTVSVSVIKLLPRTASQAALRPKSLPAPPSDWDTLVKPEIKSQPLDSRPVRPQFIGGSHTIERARWRRPVYTLAIWLAIVALGFLAYMGWRYWQASGDDETAAVPAAAVAGAEEAEAPEAAPNPTPGENGLVAAPNSPISPVATPQAGAAPPAAASTGETILPSTQRNQAALQAVIPTGPTPTPAPTIAVPAGCENKGRFGGDVTVRDGQEFAPGETFEKIWSVSNYGTCPWGPGYTLRFVGGDLIGAESQPVTSVIEPEQMGEVAVPMVAPETNGTYRGTWQLHSLNGEPFGPELYLEINVVPGAISPAADADATVLYDFVNSATQATWSVGSQIYTPVNATIDRNLVIPFPDGMVAIGPGEFSGDFEAPDNVLLTHPHQEQGTIEGVYSVDTPLQPADVLVAMVGFPRAAIINDDGAIFEVRFTPAGGQEQLIFSQVVTYDDSPFAIRQPLTGVTPGQPGVFTVRVSSGDSLSYDWATWLTLRLIRP